MWEGEGTALANQKLVTYWFPFLNNNCCITGLPFAVKQLYKVECDKRQLWPFLLLPIPSLRRGTTSLVCAGVFVHLAYCQFLLQRESERAAFAMHVALLDEDRCAYCCPVHCTGMSIQWTGSMCIVGIKWPLISCNGVNTSQLLLLLCSTVMACRKKQACSAAFIVEEMFEYTKNILCQAAHTGPAKTRLMQWMMAQHSHLYNKLCNPCVLPIAYLEHLQSA